MQPQVSNFVSEYNGMFVKSPHGISGQCVSVPSEFAVQQGWPELFGTGDGTALEIWNNGVGGYQKVVNSPANAPVAGDFMFFDYVPDGHVVLVESADTNTVNAFEQNDPIGLTAHTKAYNYYKALGWFHHPTNVSGFPKTLKVTHACNVRSAPHVSAPIVAQLQVGTVEVTGIVTGDSGTVGTHVSNQWGVTLNGHYFCLAATA